MAVTTIQKDSKYENKIHGSTEFPYTIYHSRIPEYLYSYPLHWHNEMEIIYVSSGSCVITVNRIPVQIFAGDIIFILPGTLHAIDRHENDTVDFFNIVFDILLLKSAAPSDICYEKYLKPYLENQIQLPVVVSPSHPLYPQIHPALAGLTKNCGLTSPGLELYIKSQLFTLFWILESLQIKVKKEMVTQYHASQIRKMKDLLQFIALHYASPLKLKDAADFCGYSIPHFMKFFKSFTGSTFIEYLNTYRLKKACELLLTTNLTVLEISETVGFDNHSYFIRIFKRQYGITPKKYRVRYPDR